jgi:hypothetical protein
LHMHRTLCCPRCPAETARLECARVGSNIVSHDIASQLVAALELGPQANIQMIAVNLGENAAHRPNEQPFTICDPVVTWRSVLIGHRPEATLSGVMAPCPPRASYQTQMPRIRPTCTIPAHMHQLRVLPDPSVNHVFRLKLSLPPSVLLLLLFDWLWC